MPSESVPSSPREYNVHETLRDGAKIRIRAIRPDDKGRLLEHFHGLSPASVHNRFFAMRRELSDSDLARLTELDFRDHVGLAATFGDAEAERFIGVGRYIRAAEPARAEVAFAVLDEHHGRGVGTLLLEHLAKLARVSGITEFEADVLADNRQMLTVFEQSGFRLRREARLGTVHLVFSIGETAASSKAHDERASAAAHAEGEIGGSRK